MNRSGRLSFQWVFHLAVGFLVGGVYLRSLLLYPLASPDLPRALGLTTAWLLLFLSERILSRRLRWYFPVYLCIQTVLILIMFQVLEDSDFFAVLFSILSLQILERFETRPGTLLAFLFTPLTVFSLLLSKSLAEALALGFLYGTVNALLGAYAVGMRRALAARLKNQSLVQELEEANQRMLSYSKQVEQHAAARERNHLARELHDSVTQTIFSMTLTTQSAILLLEREPSQVAAQLDHLNQLAQSALSEMQLLVSKLSPDNTPGEDLEAALRRHIDQSSLPKGMHIRLEVEGRQSLGVKEQQELFRIVQEALNNVIKHARASEVVLHLCWQEPGFIEIKDNGIGFQVKEVGNKEGVGMSSMRERANQIGWGFQITSSPGNGTCVRIEKSLNEKRAE